MFLQDRPVGYNDLYWILGAVIVLLICYFYWLKFNREQKHRERINHDTRSHIVNDSNYNLNRTGIDEHRIATDAPQEAAEGIDNAKKTDSIPTPEEFHELRQDLRNS